MVKLADNVALLLVDLQYDFLKGGSLEVPNASAIMPTVKRLMDAFHAEKRLIVATQDWHPADHASFASNHPGKKPFDTITLDYKGKSVQQVLWPDHCVQHSHGAEITDEIDHSQIAFVVQKGKNSQVDSYSAFADNQYAEITPLAKILYQHHIETVVVVGLAADYCVRMTCEDAIKFGFTTILIQQGTQTVAENALQDTFAALASQGVHVVDVDDYLESA